jgi:hypothetical protein
MRRVYDAHYEARYERLYPSIMQTYSCCYAKLYVIVHMGCPGHARVRPGMCLKSKTT